MPILANVDAAIGPELKATNSNWKYGQKSLRTSLSDQKRSTDLAKLLATSA